MFLAGSCHKGRESSRNGKALGECLVPSEADGTEPRACMQIFPKIVFLYCCLAPSSLVLLPGLCSVTAAGWQTPAFTFPGTFLGKLMRAVSLRCDKPSFLAVTQKGTEELGEGNRALARTQQLRGTFFSTYPRVLFEKKLGFWAGAQGFLLPSSVAAGAGVGVGVGAVTAAAPAGLCWPGP